MPIHKRETSAQQTFQAVYENGVLRPLRPLALKEKSRVTVTLRDERKWRADFDRLMRKMNRRTRGISQAEIEAEITNVHSRY